MMDGLDGLRHDTIICRDDQDGDIRDLRAAGTHGRESFMTRRIEENDLLAFAVDLISTDVLRDAAGLVRLHVRVADAVKQRRLAVVDMPHDRDDRRAELQGFWIILDLRDFRRIDIGRQFFARHTEFRSHERSRIKIDFLIDCCHDAHHEELLDDFCRRIAHLRSKILDGDRLRQLDVLRTSNLDLRCLLDIAALVVAAAAIAAVIAAVAIVAVIAAIALILTAVAAVIAIAAVARSVAAIVAVASAVVAVASAVVAAAVVIAVIAVPSGIAVVAAAVIAGRRLCCTAFMARCLAMIAGSRCCSLFLMMWLSLAILHVFSLRLML